jgi:hypothetical protein
MYIAGHKHTYNRMFPISGNLKYETQDSTTYLNPQYPVYVVSGAAGTQRVPPTGIILFYYFILLFNYFIIL